MIRPLPCMLISSGFHVCTSEWAAPDGEYDDFHRLYYPVSGSATMHAGGRTTRFAAGRIYLIPGHQLVGRGCRKQMSVYWLHFRPHALEADAALARLGVVRSWQANRWKPWLPMLCRLDAFAVQPTTRQTASLQALLLAIMAETIADPLDNIESQGGWIQRLRPAIKYMDENYTDHPSLDDVAARAQLSAAHFHRQFRACFHVTPHAYMERLRMRRALELLQAGDVRVGEAAEQTGYASVYYFSRAFKRFFGFPPSHASRHLAAQP